MCWSGEASLGVATLGVSGALWARSRGSPVGRWGTVFYFSAMELLQAATYVVIDRCGLPANQWLTRLSYAHIAFQPFFINLLAMSMIPSDKARKIRGGVFAICAVGAALMLAKLYVPSAAWACDASVLPLCGADTCSFRGDWHIAWRLYLNSIDGSFLCYFVPAFLLPLFYGSWRWTLYHLLVGPLPAFFMTSNKDEMPAIWCLTSIGFLLALHLKPVEHWMETPRRTPVGALATLGLSVADLRTGFGGACLLVLAYPVIRLSGGSELFGVPMLCTLFAILAAGFVFTLIPRGPRRFRPSPAAGPPPSRVREA
jgi:hypothetical protein